MEVSRTLDKRAVAGSGAKRPYERPSKLPIMHVLFCLGLLSSSFDIFLVIDIFGISIKPAQIFQLFFLILYFLGGKRVETGAAVVWPLGFKWLMFWGLFLILWTPNTYDIGFSIGYTLYFVFSCVIIYAGTRYYNQNTYLLKPLIKFYLVSYVILSAYGLVQFSAGIFGVSLLVQQWWIEGVLPRLNGFSFEPSFYATYLISGWGALAYMMERRVLLFSYSTQIVFFAIVTLAIILSSSRMALLILALYFLYYVIRGASRSLVTLKIYPNFVLILFLFIVGGLAGIVAISTTIGFGSLQFLLFGVGLGTASDYSATTRLASMADAFELFVSSPLIGYGLGGVWSYIGHKYGLPPGEATGMNITVETLAASGIIGFVFFLLFLLVHFKAIVQRSKSQNNLDLIFVSMGVGFALIFLILQFNQGIMRIYFWNHIAIMSILYVHLENISSKRLDKRGPVSPG